jgi:hypothetical protein
VLSNASSGELFGNAQQEQVQILAGHSRPSIPIVRVDLTEKIEYRV